MKTTHVGVYEFARLTGRDITSLYKLIYAKKLVAEKHGSGKRKVWRIPREQVAAWTLNDSEAR
jgi:Helix-turn-helix domain